MFTNKLIALTSRRTPVARDLFDVYYFLKLKHPLSPQLIEERTGKELKEYLNYVIMFIKKTYNSKNVLQGIGELIDKKQKDWLRKNLVTETIKELQQLL